MKKAAKITLIFTLLIFQFSCKSQIDISPKTDTVMVPAKGELKLFENKEHSSFSLNLINKNTINSCEVYTLKNGNRKWISPSLLANGSLDFNVPKDGFVLLQNYSNENITITYKIN